jgi:hypothetical protein
MRILLGKPRLKIILRLQPIVLHDCMHPLTPMRQRRAWGDYLWSPLRV